MKLVLLLVATATLASLANAGPHYFYRGSPNFGTAYYHPGYYQPSPWQYSYRQYQPTNTYFYRYNHRPYGFPAYHGSFTTVPKPVVIPTDKPETTWTGIDARLKPDLDDVVEVAKSAGGFETLLELVNKEGLIDRLKDGDCKTVLAPRNNVFEQLPVGTLDGLIADNKVSEILVRHVIPQCIGLEQIQSGPVLTAGGQEIEFIKNDIDGTVQIRSGTGLYNIVKANIPASNGVIHVVDGLFV
jgi:uncharacterized surface protein with fasciclin (FAS1) repeats